MDYNVAIIHDLNRIDRKENVSQIYKHFPEAKLFKAVIPTWEPQQDVRSIKGSSLSHALAYKYMSNGKPILVLEDDAFLALDKIPEIPDLPDNCGALVLGGEMPVTINLNNGTHEVFCPWHGAHAILYNTPKLQEKGFSENLFELIASTPLSEKAACYEGVLFAAIERCGLKLLRPDITFFTTIPTVSARTGKVAAPRHVGGIITPQIKKQEANEFKKFRK